MSEHRPLLYIRSAVPGVAWPPLAGTTVPSLLALLHHLDATQWLSPEAMRASQATQLRALLSHAGLQSPFFHERLKASGLDVRAITDPADLRALPVLTRRDVQSNKDALRCRTVPAEHLPLRESSSSGSSGVPVTVVRSAVNQLMWHAFSLREHFWQRRDFRHTLASIRAHIQDQEPLALASWGPPAALLFDTGPAHAMAISSSVEAQYDWLQQIRPHYLLSYPSNIAALLDVAQARGELLPVQRQIRTIGETVEASLKQRVAETLGIPLVDTYSSQELGVMAIRCPDSELYHVMAEGYVLEILDRHDHPCAPGEIGRVIVTDLHNLAMPLVRYDTGDYAEASEPCTCGRGLPALRRLVGRQRNMIVIDGTQRWPLFGFQQFRDVAPVRQYQLIQHGADDIEIRLVCDGALLDEHKKALADVVREALGHPFRFRFTLFPDRIPPGPSGKFEEFMCLMR